MNKLLLISFVLFVLMSSIAVADNFTVTHDNVLDTVLAGENVFGFACFGMNQTRLLQNVTLDSDVICTASPCEVIIFNTSVTSGDNNRCRGGTNQGFGDNPTPQELGSASRVSIDTSVSRTAQFSNNIRLVEGQYYIIGFGKPSQGGSETYTAVRDSTVTANSIRPELVWYGGQTIGQAGMFASNITAGNGYGGDVASSEVWNILEIGLSNLTAFAGSIIPSNTKPINNTIFSKTNISFNTSVTANLNYNVELFINGTLNQTKSFLLDDNTANFSALFNDGHFSWFLNLSNDTTVTTTDVRLFIKDTINPIHTFNNPSALNITVIGGSKLINLDVDAQNVNLHLNHFNVTNSSGSVIYSNFTNTLNGPTEVSNAEPGKYG